MSTGWGEQLTPHPHYKTIVSIDPLCLKKTHIERRKLTTNERPTTHYEKTASLHFPLNQDTGLLKLVVSQLVIDELEDAPDSVRAEFERIPETQIVRVAYTAETIRLRDAYLAAAVVGAASSDDAHHVAIATVHGVDMIASWNFKHLVNVNRMEGFNAVNEAEGYPAIAIHSPLEFIDYDES